MYCNSNDNVGDDSITTTGSKALAYNKNIIIWNNDWFEVEVIQNTVNNIFLYFKDIRF